MIHKMVILLLVAKRGHQFTKLSAMITFLRTSYPTIVGVGVGCCGLTGDSLDGAR
jgi:hypothetical protein